MRLPQPHLQLTNKLKLGCSIILILSLFSVLQQTVHAASPSPSLVPSALPTDQKTTENLKGRIDRVLEQHQQKLKQLEQNGQRQRVFIGEVLRISERTVTLRTSRGNQSFTAGAELALIKDGKKVTIDDIAVGDWMGVIGFLDKESIQPQYVFVSATSYHPPKYDTVIGTLKEVTRTQIKVTGPDKNESSFGITKTTQLQANDGSSLKREALQTDTQVIIIGNASGDQSAALLIKSLAGQR